jgi:hypothetical protein
MTLNDSDRSQPLPPVNQLDIRVDGRQVRATLTRFPASEKGPRRPRWMLQMDGGAIIRGPLTWNGDLDPAVERTAVAAFVRERQEVARQYQESHGELLRKLDAAGRLGEFANALGVAPGDLRLGTPG